MYWNYQKQAWVRLFPISRDPPEGGTQGMRSRLIRANGGLFPISRDPPEGGTSQRLPDCCPGSCFQFLGIPPKGEPELRDLSVWAVKEFPISRDPPEGGTLQTLFLHLLLQIHVSNF